MTSEGKGRLHDQEHDTHFIHERRKHKRFTVNDGAIILTPKNFGSVLDISKGGMRFQYFNWDETIYSKGKMDVSFYGVIVLTDFPFTLISKEAQGVIDDNDQPVLKQNRLQFGDLSRSQHNQLKYFLNNYGLSAN